MEARFSPTSAFLPRSDRATFCRQSIAPLYFPAGLQENARLRLQSESRPLMSTNRSGCRGKATTDEHL